MNKGVPPLDKTSWTAWLLNVWDGHLPPAWKLKTGICPRLEIGIKNQIFLENPEIGILIPINWFGSPNDSFIAGMKHTAQESGSQ